MAKSSGFGVFKGYYSLDSILTNVYYLAKWNPKEALNWLEEARYEVVNEMQANRYNKVVDQINTFLDSVEKKAYYDKKVLWGAHAPDRAVYIVHI